MIVNIGGEDMRRLINSLLFVLVFVISVYSAIADTGINQLDQLGKAYFATNDLKKKKNIFTSIIKDKSQMGQFSVFHIIDHTPEDILKEFRPIVSKYGTRTLFNGYTDYMLVMWLDTQEATNKLLGNEENPSQETIAKIEAAIEKRFEQFNVRLSVFASELSSLAIANKENLVEQIRKVYQENDQVKEVSISGPAMGLMLLKEDGYEAILSSVKGQSDRDMMIWATKAWGMHSVFPILKYYENPASDQSKRGLARTLMNVWPNDPTIYDRLAEAYRLGFFFEDTPIKKIDKNSLPDIMDRVMHNWKLMVSKQFAGDSKFVSHLGKKHLSITNGQDKIIELMADIDYPTAVQIFAEIDVEQLSSQSRTALVYSFLRTAENVRGQELPCDANCTIAQDRLHRKLLKIATSEEREVLIHTRRISL